MRTFLTLTGSILLLLLHIPVQATVMQDEGIGHRVGITLPPGLSELPDETALRRFREAGVTLIEIEGIYPESEVRRLTDAGFYLFVRQERSFTTVSELAGDESRFRLRDHELIRHYRSAAGEQTAAFALFRYPAESPLMLNLMQNYAGELSQEFENGPVFYYLSAYPGGLAPFEPFGFRSGRLDEQTQLQGDFSVIHFLPEKRNQQTLEMFRDLLQRSLGQSESIIFVDAGWLKGQLDHFEPLASALHSYTTRQEILFPFPAPEEETPVPSVPVILLLTVLIVWLLHYRFQPVYRRSMFRYFYTHKFFVEELVENRLRIPFTGLLLFIQHLLITGIYTLLAAEILLSGLGTEALARHFPFLEPFGTIPYGFFLFGMLAAAAIQLTSILWLWIPAFRAISFSQTMNLYGWPLQLNVPVIILLVGFWQSGAPAIWIELLLILYPVIWFAGFYVTAFDTARFLSRKRFLYITGTCGLHLALTIAAVWLVLITPAIREPVLLALGLP